MDRKTNIKILDQDLWNRAKQHARANGKDVSDIVFEALKAIVPDIAERDLQKTNITVLDEELWKKLKKESKELDLTVSQNIFRILGQVKKMLESTEPRFEDVAKYFGIQTDGRDIRTIIEEKLNRE